MEAVTTFTSQFGHTYRITWVDTPAGRTRLTDYLLRLWDRSELTMAEVERVLGAAFQVECAGK